MGVNDVSAEAYDTFTGRYASLLSPLFLDLAGLDTTRAPEDSIRVLDVGCGTGALMGGLASRTASRSISAVDPSARFIQAVRERYPGVHVREAGAENLPFPDGSFDVALAQLVLHFMPDPIAGLKGMQRVTRNGGVVAASVWDFEGARSPLSIFWDARELDPGVRDEALLPGARKGHLRELFAAAGLRDVVKAPVETSKHHANFDEWWIPYTGGVGSAGGYYAGLDQEHQIELRERCRARLPQGPFDIAFRAWAARAVVGPR